MLDEMFDILDRNNAGQDKATVYKNRRSKLLSLIEKEHHGKRGALFLFAPFESARTKFLQESSFYYFTGISEPASVFSDNMQGEISLYVPDFGDLRQQWVYSKDIINQETITLFGIDELKALGERVAGYQLHPYFIEKDYQEIIYKLRDLVAKKEYIFTLYPKDGYQYAQVKQVIDRLALFVPGLHDNILDISPLVAMVRRKKEMGEIELMYQSVGITHAAYQAAARILKPGASESELHAAMEYIFIENESIAAYPPIVASGKQATVLHYSENNQQIQDKDAVLIDAGAMFQHYCADITRVFPSSGKFTDRQRELYEVVLATQQHIVEHARPGMWLSNAQEQDMSLQHLAKRFLAKKGYDQYFIHGIGHFLGLDVHDVGLASQPLQEGDVITIEPGVYIPDESIGIRIEDNYWIVADAEPVCLSDAIPKEIQAVEDMVQESF